MSHLASVEYRGDPPSTHKIVVLPNHNADDVSLRLAIRMQATWNEGALWIISKDSAEQRVEKGKPVFPLLENGGKLFFLPSSTAAPPPAVQAVAAAAPAAAPVAAVAPSGSDDNVEDLKEEIEDLKREKEELVKELADAKEAAEKELAEAKEGLEKEIAELKASSERELEELKQELATAREEAESKLDELRKQLEEAARGDGASVVAPAVAADTAKLDQLTKERDEARASSARLASQLEDALLQISALRLRAATAGAMTKEQLEQAKREAERLEELERIARGDKGSSSDADHERIKKDREAELAKLQAAALDKKRMFEEKAEKLVSGERDLTADEKARRLELDAMRQGSQAGSKKNLFDDQQQQQQQQPPLSPTSSSAEARAALEKIRERRATLLKGAPLPVVVPSKEGGATETPPSLPTASSTSDLVAKIRERRNTELKATPVVQQQQQQSETAAAPEVADGATAAAAAPAPVKRENSSTTVAIAGLSVKELNKSPKTAIAAAAANDPNYDILDLSGNTMFLMKHRDYSKELGLALAANTVIREVHLKSVDLDKVDVQLLMDGLVKNTTVVLLDLEKNKIDNEGAATLALMMRQNSTIREVNLFGQAGRAFGDACLTAFVDMFAYNVTLTKIIWRLDSRKSFAINKLLVRNNTIKKNLEEGRDVSKLIPAHCNIPELLAKRAVGAGAQEEEAEEDGSSATAAAAAAVVSSSATEPAVGDESATEPVPESVSSDAPVAEAVEEPASVPPVADSAAAPVAVVAADSASDAVPPPVEAEVVADAAEPDMVRPEKTVSAPPVLKKGSSAADVAPQAGNAAHNKEQNKNPKTAIAAAAANDPNYDILDLSGNTVFQMKHRELSKELGLALATNTVIREVHLKSVDLDKIDVQQLMDGLVKNTTVVLLDLEKNKIDNEGAATLALMMRQNSTIREVNLFGQAGRAFGDACLTAFVDMFAYNVTLTKIIWRLDSRKSFAINKLLVRNNTIKKNLEEGRDVSKLIPAHCNIPELLEKRSGTAADDEAAAGDEDAAAAVDDPAAAEASSEAIATAEEPKQESALKSSSASLKQLGAVKRDSSAALPSPNVPRREGMSVKELNKSPKTAIAAAAANDPNYDILDLSGNTMFLMKHRDYSKELGLALAANTVIREVHLKSVDLDKVDVQLLMDGLVKNTTVVLLDLEKNKIDNEGAATLALMMRQNNTIREVNLFGQAGRAFGDACLTAFVDMFAYNVTLTKIIWRLDSRKSFAINKLLVRNNTIKKNLEEGRDVSKLIPAHCNIPELLAKRSGTASDDAADLEVSEEPTGAASAADGTGEAPSETDAEVKTASDEAAAVASMEAPAQDTPQTEAPKEASVEVAAVVEGAKESPSEAASSTPQDAPINEAEKKEEPGAALMKIVVAEVEAEEGDSMGPSFRKLSGALRPASGHRRNVSDVPAVASLKDDQNKFLGRSSGSMGLKLALNVREASPSSDQRSHSASTLMQLSPRMTGKLTGAQALLKWAQKRTDYKYKGVDLGNWKQAWQDGLGFCALAHHFFNDAIDFDSLKTETREDKLANCALAFKVFDERGNVPQLLDPEDVVDFLPEPRSMQTYLSDIRKRLDPQVGDSPLPQRKADLPGRGAEAGGGQSCPKCKSISNPPNWKECKSCGYKN